MRLLYNTLLVCFRFPFAAGLSTLYACSPLKLSTVSESFPLLDPNLISILLPVPPFRSLMSPSCPFLNPSDAHHQRDHYTGLLRDVASNGN